jgi:hypothetical protein
MPTTFNVFYLGMLPVLDPTEGNLLAENNLALQGMTFGSVGDPLFNSAAVLTPGSFTGGASDAYDANNNVSNDTFRIGGGPLQTFDTSVQYTATITYVNGTTATISAVVFQDVFGHTYWAPEITANADQAAMQAMPIRSLTLNTILQNGGNLAANRQVWSFLACYVAGTRILTPSGEVPIEALRPGEPVMTADHGAQAVRWVGASTVRAEGAFAPVRIEPGALGEGLPERPLLVSRQHRMLIRSRIGARRFGAAELLVPAIGLVGMPGIALAPQAAEITYLHLLFDRHEVIFAEGTPSESLYAGPMARHALGPEALAEIEALFPGLIDRNTAGARPFLSGPPLRGLVSRHREKDRPLLAAA